MIICKDSKFILDFVKLKSIDLTVTSPEYRNAIDYEKYTLKKSLWYRGTKKWKSTEEYFDSMLFIFQKVYKATKEGGYLCIIIGNELVGNNKILPLPFLFYICMESVGWNLQDEIIWNKITGGKKRFRVFVQHPFPSYYYPNIMHEHILIFRKGVVKHKKRKEIKLDDVIKKEWANSVWHIPPVPPNTLPHPCPFPEEIPYRLISLYSNEQDIVLDPFNGIGQTTKVAYNLKREQIGFDTINEFCEIAKGRLCEPLHLIDPIIPKWSKGKKIDN